jgi:serine/threonine-protein kinase
MRPLKDEGRTRDLSSRLLGHVFEGRYRIERQLGEGGIGVVFHATDTKLAGRPVAVKVLSEMMGMRKSQRLRFEREAKALAALSHPNVVSLVDYGVAESTPYLVMELLQGQPLSQLMYDEGPLEWERAVHLMNQVLAGLTYVHDRNIAHRDLKPGNLFVQSIAGMGECVKVLDFGFAKFLDPNDDGPSVTRSGEVFGTPGYMPPEQLLGKPVDTRADVYSACVLFYEMLAGQKPYFGASLAEILKRQLTGEVPRLADADSKRVAHPALDALFARGMALDVDTRYRDARELAKAILALPARAVETRADKARDKTRKSKPEPAAKAPRGSELVTVADAEGKASELPTQKRTRSAPPGNERGLFARAFAALAALFSGVLRTGAILLSLVSVVVIVGAGILIFVSSRPELEHTREALRTVIPRPSERPEPDTTLTAQHTSNESARTSDETAGSVEGTARVPAGDPWRAGVPQALRSARALMLKNGKASEKTLNALRRYNSEHPDDPRGHLLLGGLYVNRNWFSDGVQQYELAFRLDPSARGDLHALRDLLLLASQPEDVWARAHRLLADSYGQELLRELAQAEKRTTLPSARMRLVALSAEVEKTSSQGKGP